MKGCVLALPRHLLPPQPQARQPIEHEQHGDGNAYWAAYRVRIQRLGDQQRERAGKGEEGEWHMGVAEAG